MTVPPSVPPSVPPAAPPPERPRAWYRNPLVWIVLIVAVPILIALVLAPIIRPRLTRAVRDECRQQYAQARTAADS
ncbi:MAG TPA: hypothetical protein VFS40_07360, partial [Gemmatimonadales bacterium]|nr:hypothetical protein [Gemmatimonadales bacterium]